MSIDSSVPPRTLHDQAIRFLLDAAPVGAFDHATASIVIDAMRPVFAAAGTLLLEEGDSAEREYMALVLEGEVRAETGTGNAQDQVLISMHGPGSLLGEMGVIDGSPRSARCTAQVDTKFAILTQQALWDLMSRHPAVAARLLLVIAASLAQRLRESNRRLRTVSQVERLAQDELGRVQRELDAAHAVNRRLLDERGQ